MSRIVIVEDDNTIRSLVKFKLKNSGFEVVEFESAVDALQHLKSATADLILLDLMLPVMSGKEMLVALKEDERLSRIPVVILSARTLEKEVLEGLELGADDYVKKPFSPSELVARVKTVLARSK